MLELDLLCTSQGTDAVTAARCNEITAVYNNFSRIWIWLLRSIDVYLKIRRALGRADTSAKSKEAASRWFTDPDHCLSRTRIMSPGSLPKVYRRFTCPKSYRPKKPSKSVRNFLSYPAQTQTQTNELTNKPTASHNLLGDWRRYWSRIDSWYTGT